MRKFEFSVKSDYFLATGFYALHENATSKSENKWWGQIWIVEVPPRVKHFAWRMVNNLIATEENLIKKTMFRPLGSPVNVLRWGRYYSLPCFLWSCELCLDGYPFLGYSENSCPLHHGGTLPRNILKIGQTWAGRIVYEVAVGLESHL